MNDLEWLSRNVHEWPKTDSYAVVWHEKGRVRVLWDCGTQNGESFTREQWLAERERLQNKPSWEDAPEWAQWLAQDDDGSWVWYKDKPVITDNFPDMFGGNLSNGNVICYQCATSGQVLGDWRDTLESRREPNCERCEDDIAECDCSTRPQGKPMTVKEWRGPEDGLPPVGTMCEYKAPDGIWKECEVIAHKRRRAICWNDETQQAGWVPLDTMRPLRTEEEKAVEEMCNIIRDAHIKYLGASPSTDYEIRCAAIALYNEGYRKLDKPDASN